MIANLIVALASMAFGALSAVRPRALSKASGRDPGEIFYSRMYAARAIPFGLLVGGIPFVYGGSGVVAVLFTAALIQLLDGAIGLMRGDVRQAVRPLVATVVHTLCGLVLREN